MAKILDFNLSSKQFVDLALEKYKKGDIIGSARYARSALKENKRSVIAYGVLGCLFSDDSEFELANKTIFKGLHESRDYENTHLRRQLALNFLHLDLPEVAMYYTDDKEIDIIDTLDRILDEDMETVPDLYLSYPPTEEYYDRLISKAYELGSGGDVAAAMNIIDGIPEEYGDLSAKSKLVLFSMANDVDALIAFSERKIDEGRDSTAIRCTLASAYIMKNREKEALEVVRPVLEKIADDDIESMFMVLPVAVSLNMHGDIVKIIKTLNERPKFHSSRRLMIWYAQALYNIGQRDAARAVMSDLNEIYGEDAPAFYYLQEFAKNPDKVDYSLILPQSGCMRNISVLREIMLMSDDELARFDKTHTAVGDNLDYYVLWAFENANKSLQNALLARLVFYKRASEILQNCLVLGELPYGVMNAIIDAFTMLNDGIHPVEFDIVAQDRFKHIEFMLPRAMHYMPSTVQSATLLSIADIIFTDEDPNFYLRRLVRLINGIVDKNADGKAVYSNKSREKLSSVRSADTLVGVFLAYVYEEDETRESVIERYHLNEKLYDKYYKIVFGDDDDGKE
ncbi:MAG: hypothetical protein NC037_01645 [Bacteroides sp.]|nr:hypothetical protein [Bacillota bacterium]MCM1393683.1 hypothetical protein [[Eubacterium] siraeum]MCM1455218.1 hypothetical protein [Bacteroides sp.]